MAIGTPNTEGQAASVPVSGLHTLLVDPAGWVAHDLLQSQHLCYEGAELEGGDAAASLVQADHSVLTPLSQRRRSNQPHTCKCPTCGCSCFKRRSPSSLTAASGRDALLGCTFSVCQAAAVCMPVLPVRVGSHGAVRDARVARDLGSPLLCKGCTARRVPLYCVLGSGLCRNKAGLPGLAPALETVYSLMGTALVARACCLAAAELARAVLSLLSSIASQAGSTYAAVSTISGS